MLRTDMLNACVSAVFLKDNDYYNLMKTFYLSKYTGYVHEKPTASTLFSITEVSMSNYKHLPSRNTDKGAPD